MRVVLDANVLVSAVLAKGPSHRIVFSRLEGGAFEVVVCPRLLAELEDVLGRPRIHKRIAPGLADLYQATLWRTAVVVADPDLAGTITRDRNDDYLVALAGDHGADYIVTGDKDLLEGVARPAPARPHASSLRRARWRVEPSSRAMSVVRPPG